MFNFLNSKINLAVNKIIIDMPFKMKLYSFNIKILLNSMKKKNSKKNYEFSNIYVLNNSTTIIYLGYT